MKVLSSLSNWMMMALTVVGGLGGLAQANPNEAPAYKIYGQVVTLDSLMKGEQDRFYRFEKEKFQLIDAMAKDAFLQSYWEKKGKEKNLSAEKAREKYMEDNIKISDSEFKETFDKYKEHPKLKDLAKKEQEEQIRSFLRAKGESEITQTILDGAVKSKDLLVMYPRPEEPIYKMEVTKNDVVRFGSGADGSKPKSCKGDDCAITVIEYSEFQCPFCSRVLPTSKRLLDEYAGKVRWIVRDFPLNFHPRARPAAIAARCASFQDKYWEMYQLLFDNQQNLGDADIDKYAKTLAEQHKGFDKGKFDKCLASPGEAEKIIDLNTQTGHSAGVTGTPAFFVNGRRLSGALPYEEFKTIFDEELAKKSS